MAQRRRACPEVAERAGHSVAILLKTYAKCIDGQREIANQHIQKALGGNERQGTATE